MNFFLGKDNSWKLWTLILMQNGQKKINTYKNCFIYKLFIEYILMRKIIIYD